MFRNKNLTKWIPLANYQANGSDYVVFIRGNKRTGMLYFKVKIVHIRTIYTRPVLDPDLINVKKSWDEIIDLIKSV